MKLIDLLNKIANGEIKEGTKIKKNNFTYIFEDNNFYRDEIRDIDLFDVSKLNDEVEIIEEKQQEGRWKPKFNEEYYYIHNEGSIVETIWLDHDGDNFRYLIKNIFKTEKEAQEYLEYKKALLKAEKPFVKNEMNCKLTFSTIDRIALISENYDVMSQGSIYLGQDEDVAQAFIDKWHKQILKYEFGIEE